MAAFLIVPTVFSQTTLPAPKQEKLLNGLKVLMWSDAKADKVSIKLRIHSGSAFDPQGKEGVMKMLADNLFPNEATRQFFTEDLGGNLEIVANYDYIQINASSKPEGLLTMLETVATAVSNPAIDKETTAKLRTALLAKVATMEADPAYVADQAVAKRLFGTFPYGRPQYGTADSLKKIEFGDLIDAKNRFLTADNATIAISGNFDKTAGLRAIRRYFGGWLKADKKVPATFRQPDEPDTKNLRIEMPDLKKTYSRWATYAPARTDKDYYPMLIYVSIRREWRCLISGKYEAYLLRGIYVSKEDRDRSYLPFYSGPCPLVLLKDGTTIFPEIPQADFERSKARALAAINGSPAGLTDLWLDLDTYKLTSADDEVRKTSGVTLLEVKALAEKLYKTPAVSVTVVSSQKSN